MIVCERKNLKDIVKNLKGFKRVLVAGCNGCVGIYQVGGKKQAEEVAALINKTDKTINANAASVPRQCDKSMIKDALGAIVKDYDAILSLACGAGVQSVADVFDKLPVLPGNDTRFIGARASKVDPLHERCLACGNCILDKTGGICPITQCPKSILNGPCGGVYNGKCETDKNRDCIWVIIYNKLNSLGRLDIIKAQNPPKDFTKWAHPRKERK